MSGATGAAEMIRRFREGAPMPRDQREAAKAEGRVPEAMWWSTSNKGSAGQGNEKDKDIALYGNESRYHMNSSQRDPLEQSDGSEPRIGSTLQRPERITRSISPMSRIAKYEGKISRRFS
jgi:hypothetical protein